MKENVKVDTSILNKVREEVKRTKQSVGGFYDLAAEQSLNKDIALEFSRNDLVGFGTYLLSDERTKNIRKGATYKNLGKAALKEVFHADIENFLTKPKS